MFDEDWFTGKNRKKSWTDDYIESIRTQKTNAEELKKEDEKNAAEEAKKKEDEKNIFQKAGDVIVATPGAVGNFVKDAAVDVYETGKGAIEGIGNVLEGEAISKVQEKNTELINARNKEWGEKFGRASEEMWKDPDFVRQAQEFAAETNKLVQVGDKLTEAGKKSQSVDTTKTAFQAAETFLNVATLGAGKAAIKQGAKEVSKKALLDEAVKAGGREVIDQVAKKGGADVLKEVAQETLQKSAGRKLAGNMAKDATIGAAYGVTQTGKNDPNASYDEYLLNMVYGAGIGAAVPVVGAGIKKGIKAARGIPSKTPKAVDPTDVNAVVNQAIEEQADKYGVGVFARVKNWVGDQVDPNRAFAKVDAKWAKDNGIKHSAMNAEDSLEDLARRSAASEREAAGLFEVKTATGQSASDLIKKYKGDSPEGMEFNNYTNAKFDLEFREKYGGQRRIQQGLEDADLEKFVNDYEVRNPDAVKDLATKKAINDMAVDYMVKSKVLSKEEGQQIKSAYKNAVPLERVFPDDLARPEVTGKNIGSIAKQTVIQKLEGGSDIPLSNSFDTMLNRVYKAVSQGNRAKLAQKLLERSQAGYVKGGKLVVAPGNKETRLAIREQAREINKGIKYLQKKVVVSNRQMRRIQRELDALNKEGLNIDLKAGGKTPLPEFAADGISRLKETKGKTNTSRAFFKALIETDPKGLQGIRDKIATREPKLAAKLDEVMNLQTKVEANKAAKTDLKDVIAEFTDDPTTGKQVVSGVIDGQGYKLEVPPDLAKAIMGMEQQKLNGVLKAFALVKKPFEVTWTGVLNPVFSAMSAVFYDTPMSIINSPQGFKTLAPKAVIESIKSIRSSSEFQRKLAAEGARPYGGSGASSFVKPDAKSIAASRNILSSIKYSSTHPETALSKLDIWGGKLANMTRTRVARAAYDDALKKGATEKQAIQNAALAYRTVMPDFDTMSNLTRQINAVVPFYAASVAGTRSLGKALKRDLVGTTAKALALGIAPTVGVTAFSLMQPAGQDFYKDMEESGKTKTLDDNMIVVLPGAHKDKSTGEWKGIVKVPLAPEFRAMNQTTWRAVRGAMGGDGPDGSHVAMSLFDSVTGGVRTSQNPLIDTVKILAGEDPRTGERIIKGSMADLSEGEQAYPSTSDAGRFIGGVLGTSPIQGDKVLSQFGIVGQTIQNGGRPVKAVAENIDNRFTGAYGDSATSAFFETYSPIKTRRDKVSREVTDLVKRGKINEAKRKAEEFNETLKGKFSKFNKEFGNSESYDPAWDELLDGLAISTSERSFKSRNSQ